MHTREDGALHVLKCFVLAIESAPRVLKLYANRTNLGFSDAGDIEPTQTIELAESDLGRDIELRFVKFQRVQSITVRRSLYQLKPLVL